ncbi:uncharacterized protein LOC134845207 [Symsagittifera roscoffensis]|uniref:uncharacterized protein LOC134845207 n=1 Tax=Symsagittifera roscoffensis TaxID=84072 RepID=UPI00307C3521
MAADTKAKLLFWLFIQSVIFSCIIFGHGNQSWNEWEQESAATSVYGGVWVLCRQPSPGCQYLESSHMPEGSGDWAKVCASRAFLLLSNVVGVIEMLFILLSVYEVVNKFGPTCSLYSGHVTLMVIQGVFAFLAATLMTDAFHVNGDSQGGFKMGYCLLLLWLGAASLLPLLVAAGGQFMWTCNATKLFKRVRRVNVAASHNSEHSGDWNDPVVTWRINNTYEKRTDYNLKANNSRKELWIPPPETVVKERMKNQLKIHQPDIKPRSSFSLSPEQIDK